LKKKKREKKESVNMRKIVEEEWLREMTVNIGLERINIQEGIIIEVLLNSRVMSLAKSSEFVRKQRFKLKKIERPIYMINVNRTSCESQYLLSRI